MLAEVERPAVVMKPLRCQGMIRHGRIEGESCNKVLGRAPASLCGQGFLVVEIVCPKCGFRSQFR